jgi:hypothetical protein
VGDIPKSLIIGGHETSIRVGEKDETMEAANARGRFNTDELTIDIYGPHEPVLAASNALP